MEGNGSCKRVFCGESDGLEQREVTGIFAESVAVLEVTSGPVTELAYGCGRHAHKLVCERSACARVLGVEEGLVADALAGFFAPGAGVQLSDLMDRFDRAGEHYAYLAWAAGGDAVMRSVQK